MSHTFSHIDLSGAGGLPGSGLPGSGFPGLDPSPGGTLPNDPIQDIVADLAASEAALAASSAENARLGSELDEHPWTTPDLAGGVAAGSLTGAALAYMISKETDNRPLDAADRAALRRASLIDGARGDPNRSEMRRTLRNRSLGSNYRKRGQARQAAISRRGPGHIRTFNGKGYVLVGDRFKTKAQAKKAARGVRAGAYYNARVVPTAGGYRVYVGQRKTTRNLNRRSR